MIRLITMDATDTLFRFAKTPGQLYAEAGKLFGLCLDSYIVDQAFRSNFKKQSNQSPNFGYSGEGWKSWWLNLVKDTLISSGIKPNNTSLLSVGHYLIEQFCEPSYYKVFDQTVPLLELVKSKNIALGVVSNFDDRLETILLNLGIRNYFNFIINSYSAGVTKPDSQIFAKALFKADPSMLPSEALHIGDSLILDYLAAKNCGWNSFLVSCTFKQQCKKHNIEVDYNLMFSNLDNAFSYIEQYLEL